MDGVGPVRGPEPNVFLRPPVKDGGKPPKKPPHPPSDEPADEELDLAEGGVEEPEAPEESHIDLRA